MTKLLLMKNLGRGIMLKWLMPFLLLITFLFGASAQTTVENIQALRSLGEGAEATISGEVFVVLTSVDRNQKWISDATGGIVIDDSNGVITTAYSTGDGITGLTGTLSVFNDLVQFVPSADPGEASSTGNTIEPTVVTISEFNSGDYQGQLVSIEDVTFSAADGTLTFGTGSDDGDLQFGNYTIVNGNDSAVFRAEYTDADYLGEVVPEDVLTVTGVASIYRGTSQLIARDAADIGLELDDPVNPELITVASIAELRGVDEDVPVEISNEVVVVLTSIDRNQKWISDATGGIVIDDAGGVITTELAIGDGVTGLKGSIGIYNDLVQFVPSEDSGDPTSTDNLIEPTVVTISEFNSGDYQGQLVSIEDVSFPAADGTLSFSTSGGDLNFGNYAIVNGEDSAVFRAEYTDADYIDVIVPEGSLTITGVASEYQGTAQLVARNGADLGLALNMPSVSSIAELREIEEDVEVKISGEVIVVLTSVDRNQKWIADETGGIIIDDSDGIIITALRTGDGVTGLTGYLSSFNDLLQFIPTMDAGEPSSIGNTIEPTEVTIEEFNSGDFEGQLVSISGVSFTAADETITFSTNGGDLNFGNYTISDGVDSAVFRAEYSDADYLDAIVPGGILTITGVASEYRGTAQLIARNTSDILASEQLTLQLLHYADVDGNETTALDAVDEFSALIDAFQNDATYGANTLTVTSGDIIIPGPRFYAAEQSAVRDVTGSNEPGHVDIEFANTMGVDVATIGNHELDAGPGEFFDAAFSSETGGANSVTFPASQFPWVSSNIDFSNDGDFASAIGPDGANVNELQAKVAKYTIKNFGYQQVGIIGAASPTFPSITSTGELEFVPGDDFTNEELAAVIQESIDALKSRGVNKIVLLAHMQQIEVEKALAESLDGIDIIVAGGSNTRMGDSNDVLFTNENTTDEAFDEGYPYSTEDASGNPVLVVNVDGDYKYLGRLVVDFDEEGNIDLTSVDESVSGAYASTSDVVAAVGGNVNERVVEVRDAVQGVIDEQYGNIVGYTDVYLDGRRSQVRTQETNLGNLSADVNLWYANLLNPDGDASVDVSLKNGGGIRTEIGSAVLPGGSTDPDEIVFNAPEDNGVSEGHLRATLRFDNGLVRLTVTPEELVKLIEHGIAESEEGTTPGRFPQVAGVAFTYSLDRTPYYRILDLTVTKGDDDADNDIIVMENGRFVAPEGITFNMVTLNFLANGGDDYPFVALSAPNRINYYEGLGFGEDVDYPDGNLDADPGNNSAFSYTGGEQDAFAEYMMEFHATLEEAYDIEETPAEEDTRILVGKEVVTLDEESATFEDNLSVTVAGSFQVPGEVFDESAAEIPAYDLIRGQVFFTDANSEVVHVLDIKDPTSPTLITSIELEGAPNSVAIYGNIVAVATEADPKQDPGQVEFFNAADYTSLGTVTVGALPDMITFNEDGTKVLTANEGEPSDDYTVDPEGSISIVTLNERELSASTVETADFTTFNAAKEDLVESGVRIFGPNASVAQDLEPEYITVSNGIAYVACQENNALAIVDIASATVTSLLPLGYQDHSEKGNGLDASNEDDAIQIALWPVKGLYMPDAIASYVAGDKTYLVTANEGDARDYDEYSEEDRIKDVELDPVAFPNADFLQEEENLGRLKLTLANGDTDSDGDFDELYSFGTRSFTIWDAATGSVVWDSKNAFEQLTAQRIPEYFNATNDENNFDNRSDDKGPEPEGVVIGEVAGKTYAFIGLERVGGIVTYDITDPAAPVFANYINNRDFSKNDDEVEAGEAGDLAPEGLAFVPAENSPTLKALLVVTNEVSGTVTTYEVGEAIANSAPVVVNALADMTEDEGFASTTIDIADVFSDANQFDELSYSVSSSDEAVATVALEGTILTITEAGIGATTITVTASDGDLEASDEFTFTINNVNEAPAITAIDNQTVDEGASVSVEVSATDADGDDLTITAESSDAAIATVSVEENTLTVDGVSSGTATITVSVSDGELTASTSFEVTVNPVLSVTSFETELVVFPTVTTGQLSIEHPYMTISKVSVFTTLGQLVRVAELNAEGGLDLSDLEAGVYLLQISDELLTQVVIKRVVKK